MNDRTGLHWLPEAPDFRPRLAALPAIADPAALWAEAVELAGSRLDFTRTNALDQALHRAVGEQPPAGLATRPVRLAVLGSSTLAHLLPALRVGALRRGLHLATHEGEYGQSLAELMEPQGALRDFAPNAVLFAFDAGFLARGLPADADAAQADAALAEACALLDRHWRLARALCDGPILQQTVLNTHPALMGSNEQRMPGSRRRLIDRLNAALRPMADEAGIDLLALDDRAAQDGLASWHDPALWHRSKQEVKPNAAPLYGDLAARLLAARQGLSAKCLVLDLDNTLWGGVIGDDGMDGIVLGQGSPLGEAFAAVQGYARDLSQRGIILAVSSKNDEANALEPFERHPEMVLRRPHIAAFRANWTDKATNIRAIARELSIGLDALVFLDDNPFERALVRKELPMVRVPEVDEDPATVPATLADAGYFEAVALTADDRQRSAQYQQNRARAELAEAATDLPAHLRGLQMRMIWSPFDPVGRQRIVQLINKSNQFNLTTRRYTEEEVAGLERDPHAIGLQMRLLDRFGDNGMIAVVIGRLLAPGGDVEIDSWLMSCRVLGRQVEQCTLNLLAAEAARIGGTRLVGRYLPTKKNAMVRDHYERLGFTVTDRQADGASTACLDLTGYVPVDIFIETERAAP